MADVLEQFASRLRETHPEVLGERSDPETLRELRERLQPLFARVYGITPSEFKALTLSEFRFFADDLEALSHG